MQACRHMRKLIRTLFLLVTPLCSIVAQGPNAAPVPYTKIQFFDNNGVPLAFGKLYSCVAGSSCPGTPLPTYTDSTAGSANANPTILDSAGRSSIWLGASEYKLVLQDSNGGTIWTQDNVADLGLLVSKGIVPVIISSSITAKIINGVEYADQYPGANIGQKINAAFSDCGGGNISCQVFLRPGQIYPYNTTIVLPSTITTLDCNGSTLNWQGGASTDAMVVQSATGPIPYYSGGFKNCFVIYSGGSNNVTGIHQQSRIGFVYENVGVRGFNTTGSACMAFENMVGVTSFNEQNTMRKVDLNDCKKHIRLYRTNGTDSFQYNNFDDVHFDVEDGQIGFSLEGNSSDTFPSVTVFGGHFNFRFNINSAAVAATAVSLTNKADWERSEVNITGEQTSGATMSHALVTDATSALYVFGNLFISGTNNIIGGSVGSAVVHPTLNLNGAVHYEQSLVTLQQRHCKFDSGPTNATFWLASYGGTETNCNFQIIKRNTSDPAPDVDVQGSGAAPINILYTDPFSGNVGIGPGFSDGAKPTQSLDLNGGLLVRGNTILGATKAQHVNTPSANTDLAFKLIINAAATSATYTYNAPYNSVPICVAAPNTVLTLPGAGALPAPFGYAVDPSNTSQLTIVQQPAQGGAITYFVHCIGSPN